MNPVLLKSGGRRESDGAYLCSVLVMGKHYANEDFGALGNRTEDLRDQVLEAHASLARVTISDLIVVEGAGSCTELNLMERDIVNLPLVRRLNCLWLLVADIDKGGVFAQIVGTKACVTEDDWRLCCGIVINRLRGEVKYFEPGPSMIEEMVGKKVFVVPWVNNLHLPEEDAVGIETKIQNEGKSTSDQSEEQQNKPLVVVVAFPHIAIESDILPLERDESIRVEWRRNLLPNAPYPETAAVVLPGSRLTRSDLKWLTEETGWGEWIINHVQRGGTVLGLCGGYQMLGTTVNDENGIDGPPGITAGLGLLSLNTTFAPVDQKIVMPRSAQLLGTNEMVQGFELRCGRTEITSPDTTEPVLRLNETGDADGARVGNVSGSYLHGLLESATARQVLLNLPPNVHGGEGVLSDPFERLADHLEACGLTNETMKELCRSIEYE
jgi:adenosylcobyric acid synthase